MFLVLGRRADRWAMKADELPGPHAPLRERTSAVYRELPASLRRAVGAAPQRAHGHAARAPSRAATSRRTTRTSSVTPDQIQDEIFDVVDYARYLYDLFGLKASSELSTRPDNKLGTDEEWDFTEAALRGGARTERDRVRRSAKAKARSTGRRSTCTWTTRSGARGRWGRSSSTRRCRPGSGSSTSARTTRSTTPYVVHRALFGSLERFIGILIEHYGGAFPFWLAPVQVRVIPVGEDHREAAQALAGKLGEFRVEVDDSDETVGKRIRNAEVEKIPYVVVWGDKESEGAIAVRDARRRAVHEVSRRASGGAAGRCYGLKPAKQGQHVPHLRGREPVGGSTEKVGKDQAVAAQRSCYLKKEEADSLVKRL